MTDLADNLPELRQILATAAPPLALGVVGGLLCYAAAGASLGLFFGGLAIGTMLLPPIALGMSRELDRWIALGAVVDGIGVVWLAPVLGGVVSLGQWLECYLLLGAYLLAVLSVALLLRRARVVALGASAIAVALGLAWLSWPLWLAPWLHGAGGERAAAWLVPAHPLFSMNAVLQQSFGIWTQHPLIYRWINLGQDVAYQLPAGPWVGILVPLLFSTIVLVLAGGGWTGRPGREPRPTHR